MTVRDRNIVCQALQLGLIVGILLLVGCYRGQSNAARQTQTSHLRSLITLYNSAASKLGHRPANEAELKSFIAANASQMIDSLHVGSAAELFVSERDGKPFIVLYGEPPKGTSRDVIAYEQTGVDAKRFVGYSLGMMQEVDEQELSRLVPKAANP
jgi:hypothetical protein